MVAAARTRLESGGGNGPSLGRTFGGFLGLYLVLACPPSAIG
jgi:hypothetical protein